MRETKPERLSIVEKHLEIIERVRKKHKAALDNYCASLTLQHMNAEDRWPPLQAASQELCAAVEAMLTELGPLDFNAAIDDEDPYVELGGSE